MLHKAPAAPLSLKEVSFLLQLSTEQAFTTSSLRAKSASLPLTARYAHFTLTAPLLNATHTPVEIAKGSSSTPLTLVLNALYVQLTHGRVKSLQGASTTALTSTTSSATRPPATTTPSADFTSLNPVRMHFIYRLHLENEHTSETAENAPQQTSTEVRHENAVTLSTNTPSRYLAQLKRLYINDVRIIAQ